jgi:hypothetical protein
MSETVMEDSQEEIEVGTLETLPSAITFCLENNSEVKYPEFYGEKAAIKIDGITLAKDAP